VASNNLIYDIGAFEGQDTEFYLLKGFKVLAVEANPDLLPAIRQRNEKYIKQESLIVIGKAISDQVGPVALNIYENAQWSSLFMSRPGISKTIYVDVIHPVTLFRDYGVPYYLKIDIESADTLVLQALMDLQATKPAYVSFEISPGVDEGLEMLSRAGYSQFKVIDQLTVPSMEPPFPAKEGMYADYQFTHANTGLFGAELPGEWLSLQKARCVIQEIDWDKTSINGWKSWYDVHAKL